MRGGSTRTDSRGWHLPRRAAGGVAISAAGQSVSSGTVTFSNANGVSFGMAGSVITATVQPGAAAGIAAFQVSNTTYTSGTVLFSNANGISFGSSGANGVTASYTVPTQTNQTIASGNIAGTGLTTTTTGGVLLVGTNSTNGLSLGVPNWISTYAAQTNQTVASGNIAGTGLTTTTTAGVSLVGTHNTAGLSLGVPNWITTYAAQTNQTVASGNIAGTGLTTTTTGGVVLVGTNNTAGLSLGVPNWITTYAAQTTQTQAAGSIAGIGTTTTTQAGSTLGATLSTNGLSLAIPNWLTVAAGGGGAAISAAGNSVSNGTVVFSNNAQVSFGMAGSTITASINAGAAAGIAGIAVSDTTFTSGTVVMSNNGGALTIGSANQSVLFSVPQTSSIVGVNGISISTNGSTISVSNQQWTGSWFQPEVYGNTLASVFGAGTVYIRPFEVDNYFNVNKIDQYQSFNSRSSTASFSASVSNASSSSGSGSWGLTGTYLIFSRVQTAETGASYNSIITAYSNTYSLTAGYSASCSWNANVSSATNSVTTAYSVGFPGTIGTNGAVTYGNTGTTGSTSFSSTSTAIGSFSSSFAMPQVYSHFSGQRALFMPAGSTLGTTALTPGEYWLGVLQSTNSGSTNMSALANCANMSDVGHLFFTVSSNNYMEIGNSVAFTTSGIRPIYGSANVSSATTTNLALSTFSNMASHASMWFALDGRPK